MAQSDELNANPKIGASLESSVQRQDQQTPITCHLCEQVFLDTKTLVNHFKSHSCLNGSVKPNSLVQSSVPPENEIKYNSDNSHSSSEPMNTPKNTAKENLGTFARQTVASNPSKRLLGDSLVSPQSKSPAELIFKHQPYPLPSISHSAMLRGVSGSHSCSNGKQNFRSPGGPKTSAIINPKLMEGSKLRLGDSTLSPSSKKPAELIFKHQPYPSPSISRLANHVASGSGSGSRSNGKQKFSSPSWPKPSAIINSKIMEGSKLPLDDSVVSAPSKKPAELIFRHRPYPSPSIFGSAMNHGILGPRSRSRSNGKRNFSDLIWPKTSAIINSKNMEGSKILRGDSLVSPFSKKPAEWIFRHQTYPSPSLSRSAMNYGLLGSHTNGKHYFGSPIWPKTSAIINSKIMEGSNFHFPMMQFSFPPPATVGLSSQSVAGTSGLGCGKHLQTTLKCDMLGHLPLSTKPFINQLERPIEEMTTDGENDAEELDLTLKLCEF